MRRSNDERAFHLTKRLLGGLTRGAEGCWNPVVSWAEEDGVSGALAKLNAAEALVLMGGPDVHPSFYGGSSQYKNQEVHFPTSDQVQIALVRHAIDHHIPTLAICRGLQITNVALGGTLIQDMSELPGHRSERLLENYLFDRHEVSIEPGSKLSELLTPLDVVGNAKGTRIEVHSAHHQAIGRLGEGLAVTAHADDGTVEAVEHETAPLVAVQWHPEDPDADPRGLQGLMSKMCKLKGSRRLAA